MATYYLSPTGNDSTGNGSVSSPYFTLEKVWDYVAAGDTVYMRGGTYEYLKTQWLTGVSGTSGNIITVCNYPGEHPIIQKHASWVYDGWYYGVLFQYTDYIHFKGIELTGFIYQQTSPCRAVMAHHVNHSIFENLSCHHNEMGMMLTGNSDGNLILNCDFYENYDPYSPIPYGNADGLDVSSIPAPYSNTVIGCRAWYNSDDGFDFWASEGIVYVYNCWAWANGYREDHTTTGGDGNGFKLGQVSETTATTRRYLYNCIGAINRVNNFSHNIVDPQVLTCEIYNCFSYGAVGYAGYQFNWGAQAATNSILRNNISYNDTGGALLDSWITNDHNSWNSGFSVSAADFISLDASQLFNSRQLNGALPTITFGHLVPGSALINAGIDVGLPYRGTAPDLGAFEYSVGKTRNSSSVWSSADLKQYSSFPKQENIITGTNTIDCKNLELSHLRKVLVGASSELFTLGNLAGTFVEGGESGKINAWARYKPGQTAYVANNMLPAACDANPTFTYTAPGSPPGVELGDFAGYYHLEDTKPVYWGSPHQTGEYVIYSTIDIVGGLSRGRLCPILSSDVEDETYWSWVRVQAWLKENSGAYSLISTSSIYDWLADPAPTLFVMGAHGETAGNNYTLCLRPVYVAPTDGITPIAVCEGGVEILTYRKWGTAEDVADTFTVDVNTITSYDLGGGWLHMRIDYNFNINNLMTNALDCDVRLRVTDNDLAWQQDFIIGYGVHINASSSLNFTDTDVEITETIVDDGTCTVNVQVSFDSGVSWVTIGVLSSTLPSYNNI